MKYVFLVVILSLFLVSCKDDDLTVEERFERDLEEIDEFLAENNITAQIDPDTGLRYVVHEQGSGEFPTVTDSIAVNFEGNLLENGDFIDSGEDVVFLLSDLILGWQIGVPLIQEGGSMTLYIPSIFAFGPAGTFTGSVPPNANVIFDLDLLEIR